MKSKKKVLIVFVFIIAILIIVCCSIILINKNKVKHIYDENGCVRGLTLLSTKKDVCQTLKAIYGELPKENKNGDPYEIIENFDGIETCTATVMYELDKKYKHYQNLERVYVNLNSTNYSSDELYEIMLGKLTKLYGEQQFDTDDRGETIYDKKTGKPITRPWSLYSNEHGHNSVSIYMNEKNLDDGNLYQVIIKFVY